jgi:hypothetical protein
MVTSFCSLFGLPFKTTSLKNVLAFGFTVFRSSFILFSRFIWNIKSLLHSCIVLWITSVEYLKWTAGHKPVCVQPHFISLFLKFRFLNKGGKVSRIRLQIFRFHFTLPCDGLLLDADIYSNYIESNDRLINYELRRMWKEAVVAWSEMCVHKYVSVRVIWSYIPDIS